MSLPHDLRFAVRRLLRQPGLTALVTGTIAIGIATAATAFSLINAAFLRPPAVDRPDRLVNLYTTRADGSGHGAFSFPDYLDLANATTGTFSGVFGYSGLMATWSEQGRAATLFGELVTGSYFPALGVQPALGRFIGPDDDRIPGQHPVVVIGGAFWRTRLGSDADVIGRALTLNGRAYTVIGVAPDEFTGLLFRGFAVDAWVPTMMMGQLRTDQLGNRGERWMFTRARLAPGVTPEGGAAAAAAVASRLRTAHPLSNAGRGFVTIPSAGVWLSPDADGPLVAMSALLLGACLLTLAVGLANIASLLAARLVTRARELAVHAALGATRGRLLAQLFCEALLLAGAGGAIAIALAAAAARALSAYRPALPVPVAFNVTVDGRVIVFALILTLVAAGLIALVQIRRISRADATGSLRSSTASFQAGRSRRHWLLVPQVAGSVILLVLAALLTRSVANASRIDPGFDPAGVGMLTFSPGTSGLDEAGSRRFLSQLAARSRERPGIRTVTIADRIPLDLYGSQAVTISVDGGPETGVQTARVAEDYFLTLGIPVLEGRAFTAADLAGAGRIAVVNQAFAHEYWPAGPASGRTISLEGRSFVVGGVVGDAKVQTLSEPPTPMLYLPLDSGFAGIVRLIVKTTGPPDATLEAISRDAGTLRADVTVVEQRTMSAHVSVMLLPFQLGSELAGLLGALAVALAGVGLHGLVSMTVASRTREFGVRAALGATPFRLARAALADTARATSVGLIAGLAAAALAARAMAAFVFGISPLDPIAFASVAGLVLGVSLAATTGPVRRLTRASPVTALHAD